MDPRQLDALAKRLGQDPGDAEALSAAYEHGQTDPRGYAVFLEKAGSTSTDPGSGAHWYVEASQVWLTSLSDPHRAVRALMSAVEKDPTHEVAAEKLAGIYREKGDLKGVLALLDRRAKLIEKLLPTRPELTDVGSAVLVELARVQSEELGRPDGALIAYKRAIAMNPSDSYSIYMARELLKAANKFSEAIPLFAAEQKLLENDAERSHALYLDEAEVCKSAGDHLGMQRALRKALALDSSDPALKQQLAAITLERIQAGDRVPSEEAAEACELFVSLAESYDGEYGMSYATCALGCDSAHDRALQLAIYYADSLGRREETAPFAAAYLTRNPDGVMGAEARAVVKEALGRVFDEAYIQALRPSKTATSAERALALADVGAAFVAHAKKTEAERAFREALAASPAQPEALEYLSATYKSQGKHRDLFDLFARAAKEEEAQLTDRVQWLEEAAAIADGPLRDVGAAIEARRQLVLLDPSDETAADQLEATLSEAKKWDELAELLARRAEVATDVELRLARLRKLVTIQRDKRGDKRGLAVALSSLARLEPDEPEHAEQATLAFASVGERDEAIALLEALRLEIAPGESSARYSRLLGDLYVEKGEPLSAGTAFSQAAELLSESALWGKAEAEFERASDHDQAARCARARADLARSPTERAGFLRAEAHHRVRLGDADGATDCLLEAVRSAPGQKDLAEELEARYREQGRPDALSRLLLELADAHENRNERATLLKRAAAIFKSDLHDEEGMRQALVLLLDSEEDPEALRTLSDDAEGLGDLSGALSYLTRLEALSIGPEKAQLAHRSARLMVELGDDAGALGRYDVALEVDPGDLEALTRKAELESKLGDAQASAKSYKRLTELTIGPTKLEHARKLSVLLEENLDDADGAVSALEIVIDLDKDDLAAVERIAGLLERLGRWAEFARYQAQLVEFEGDPEEAFAMARKLAEVLVSELDRKKDAMAVLLPFARDGVEEARSLYVNLGDELELPAEVAESLRNWLTSTPPGPKRNHLLRSAFDRFVLAGRKADARDLGIDLARLKGVDLEVAEKLEAIAIEVGDADALRAAFAALGRELTGTPRALEFVRQAEVLRGAGVPVTDAIVHGEEALLSVPMDEAEPFLTRLAGLADDKAIRIAVYERQASRAKTLEERRTSLCRAAEVALEHEEREKALELMTLALATAQPDEGLDELIAEVRVLDEKARGTALRTLLLDVLSESGKAVRDGGRTRGALLRRAGELAFSELKDKARSLEFFRESLIAHVDEDTLLRLEDVASESGDLKAASDIIGQALVEVHDGPLVRTLLRRRHQLRKYRLDDESGAAEDLKKLYEISPGDTEIAEQLEAHYQQTHDTRGLVHLYEDRILRSRDALLRGELARKVAVLWQEELKNPRETADAWRRVLRLNPSDLEAKENLDRAKLEMRKITAADLAKSEEAERARLRELEAQESEQRAKAQAEADRIRKEKEEKLKGRLRESLPPPPSVDDKPTPPDEPEAEAPVPPLDEAKAEDEESVASESDVTANEEAVAASGSEEEKSDGPKSEGAETSEGLVASGPESGVQEEVAETSSASAQEEAQDDTAPAPDVVAAPLEPLTATEVAGPPGRNEGRTVELSPEEAKKLMAEAEAQNRAVREEEEPTPTRAVSVTGKADPERSAAEEEVTALHRVDPALLGLSEAQATTEVSEPERAEVGDQELYDEDEADEAGEDESWASPGASEVEEIETEEAARPSVPPPLPAAAAVSPRSLPPPLPSGRPGAPPLPGGPAAGARAPLPPPPRAAGGRLTPPLPPAGARQPALPDAPARRPPPPPPPGLKKA